MVKLDAIDLRLDPSGRWIVVACYVDPHGSGETRCAGVMLSPVSAQHLVGLVDELTNAVIRHEGIPALKAVSG